MFGLLLTLAIVPQGSNQARLHPDDAMVMVEMPDITKVVSAYEKAPMIVMLRDPDVHKGFFGALEGSGFDIQEVTAEALRSMGMPDAFAEDPLGGVRHYLDGIGAASFSLSLDRQGMEAFGPRVARLTEVMSEIAMIEMAIAGKAIEGEANAVPPKGLAELGLAPEAILDPWNHPYDYQVAADGSHVVRSLGADGKPGGTGDNEDISTDQAEGMAQGFVELIGFQLVVEFKNQPALEELRTLLSGLVAKTKATPVRSGPFQMSGVQAELQSWAAPGDEFPGLEVWMMRAQNMLVIGGGRSTPEAFAGRMGNAAAKTAAEPFYAGLTKDFGAATGATIVQGSLRLADYAPALRKLSMASGDDGSSFEALEAVLPNVSLRMQLVGERFVSEVVTRYVNPTGMTKVACNMAPFSRDLLSAVPEDAIGVYVAGLDAPMMWTAFKDEVTQNEEIGQQAQAHIDEMEAKYGFSIEKDLVGSLGKGVMMYLLPLKGVTSIPGMAVVVDVQDPEAMQRGIEGLMAMLKDEAGESVHVRYKPYQKVPLWTFSMGGQEEEGAAMNPLANAFSPSIALVKNRLLVTLNSMHIKKEIKRALGEEQGVHVIATEGHLPPASATSYGYMDWASLLNGIYEGGKGLLGMMGSGGPVPIDATALPEPSVFTRFYKPTTYYTRAIPDGIYMRNESSFGPETWGTLLAAGMVVGMASSDEPPAPMMIEDVTVGIEEPASGDGSKAVKVTTPQATQTREAMRQVATAIAVYQMDTGKYPGALTELSKPTKNYPAGFLKQGALPQDGWGRAFVYSLLEGGSGYKLWSQGADGVDQQGEGDDIVSP